MNRTEVVWPLHGLASVEDAVATLRACISPASFWTPERLGPQMSWLEHAPFAFWLVDALRPRTLVELGTHGGFSYFTFCEAVQRGMLDTRCYAIDTWTGDEHAGFYGEEVFGEVASHNARRYAAFSTLLRSTFDAAASHFSDGTIDLLHIDGRHFYEDAKHDFETWQPKLSAAAIVLFHDVNVRERGFGVFRLWEELRARYPHFEFLHGHGLGVLAMGTHLPASLRDLFAAAAEPETTTHIRTAYARLGTAVSLSLREHELVEKVEDIAAKAEGLTTQLAQQRLETGTLREELAAQAAKAQAVLGEVSALAEALAGEKGRTADLESQLARSSTEAARLETELAAQTAQATRLEAEAARRAAEAESSARILEAEVARRAAEAESSVRRLEAEAAKRAADLEIQLAQRSADAARLEAKLAAQATHAMRQEAEAAKQAAEAEARARRQEAEAAKQLSEAEARARRLESTCADACARLAELEIRLSKQTAEGAHREAELMRTRTQADSLGRELDMSQRQLQWMLASTSWQVTWPLRRLGSGSPTLAKYGRRVLNSLWRSAALQRDVRARLPEVKRMIQRGPDEFPDLERLRSRLSASDVTPKDCRLLESSEVFDQQAYRAAAGIGENVAAAEHYLAVGWRQGLEPGPKFEGAFLQPYYRSAGFAGPPALTYLLLRAAGRPAYATRAAAEAVASVIRASDLFDHAGYAARLGAGGGIDPALHYVIVGEQTGFLPSERFDPEYYGERYPDVGQQPINRLSHYLTNGCNEGRRPLPVAATLDFDRSRLKTNRETVLLVVHEASRTGAPILAYNLAKRLRRTYNVVAVLLAGGDLIRDFEACCAAVVGPLTYADWHPGEMNHLVRHILAAYPVSFAIVNSIASWMSVPALGRALVPIVLLVHEFASYTRPKSAMREGLHWATQLVFSAELVARSAREEHPDLMQRPVHILPQGRCDLPPVGEIVAGFDPPPDLTRVFRPPGMENALVVLGCGFVHIRKGVDLFLSCAAAVAAKKPKRPVRFVWIGRGYDPEEDASYSCYLADQIARSGLEDMTAIIDEIPDLAPAYAMTDVFLLSSRLDPLPNVTIDAAMQGLPVVCFEGTTGMADILRADASTRQCVVPHLDVNAAADVIVSFANDEAKRRKLGEASRKVGQATFDMSSYVPRVAQLGREAVALMRQRREDLATLRDDPLFDSTMYLPYDAPRLTRSEAIVDFVARWAVVGTTPASRDYFFRRPCAGFHPQIYANENAGRYDASVVNPLAHFIRSGRPGGPWRHDVITPAAGRPSSSDTPPTALHAHFHYPELAEDFFRKLGASRLRCDLLLSTDESGKARILRREAAQYQRGEVHIRVVRNRGRDIGAFLTGFRDKIRERYEIIGHVHAKKSVFASGSSDPYLGDRWREFLWQNLLGDENPMMDIVVGRMAADAKLGLVFPDNPQLPCWDGNRTVAEQLAERIGITEPLPAFFEFPVGTMFWARRLALKPLFALDLDWDDYPAEPIATDGTVMHALERLLPMVARHADYRFATTNVPGITW